MKNLIKCKDCFVYISENVQKKKNYDINQLNNFANQLKSKTATEIEVWLSDNVIKRNFLYKKNLADKRCIIQKKTIDNETVFIIRAVMKHDKEYELICHFPDDWLKSNPLGDSDLKKIKDEIQKEKLNKEHKKPPVPEELLKWLIPEKMELDLSIYESLYWINNLNHNFSEHKSDYYNLILSIVDNQISPENLHPFKLAVRDRKFYVLFKDIHYYNEQKKCNSIIYFLVNHYYEKRPTQDDVKKILNECKIDGELTKEKILPLTRRAYPDWVLADRDIWYDLEGLKRLISLNPKGTNNQNEFIDTANLALSGEEENILKTTSFPIFINGQAGSGKSTILYYLFANFCYKKLIMDKNNRSNTDNNINLLFLTYSDVLSQETKRILKEILRRNPNFNSEIHNSSEINKLLSNSVLPFQEFLLKKCLPDKKLFEYSSKKYLSFNLFKNLYNGKVKKGLFCSLPEKKHYSPELVWHIVRTFIKGTKYDTDLTPEEYSDIEKKDKSIDDEKYKIIYDEIYTKWYKNRLAQYYWDDQDLVKDVLKLIKDKTFNPLKYAVIFCDEAQDFTKNEFELLAELLVYNNYDLSFITNIPLAFAGDPLQTLNPTGFNWNRVSAKFYEKINLVLKANKINIIRKNLSKNYRSKPDIVKFANLIQFTRASILETDKDALKNFTLQESWNIGNGNFKVHKFIINENITEEQLLYAKNTPIIIPFDGDDVKDFIQNDNHLKKISVSENNIWTPVKSKGLEFPKVILYKFGDGENGKLFQELINSFTNNTIISDDLLIKGSYLFNKLYVAITRAKNYLFIIDTKEGDENLWQYFTFQSEKDIIKKLDEKIINENQNKYFDYIYLGNKDKIIELKDDNPEETAQELYQKGKRSKDAELLHRAAYQFKLANKPQDAKISEAEAYEAEGQWTEAGKIWEELVAYENAAKCYWKDTNWEKIIELFDNELVTNLDAYRIATFMINSQTNQSVNFILETFCNPSTIDHLTFEDETSVKVIKRIKEILEKEFNNITNYDKQRIASCLDRALNRGFYKDLDFVKIIGKYHLYGHNYFRAEEIFRKYEIFNPEYHWAKFFISSSPLEKVDSLIYIDFNQSFNGKSVERYIEEITRDLNENNDIEVYKKIANYYYKNKKYEKAVKIWERIGYTEIDSYFYSRYKLSNYNPEKIKWFAKYISNVRGQDLETDISKDPYLNELMKLWDEVKINKTELDDLINIREKNTIFRLLNYNNKTDEALSLIKDCKLIDDIIEFVRILNNKKISDDNLKFSFFKNLLKHDIRDIRNYFKKQVKAYNELISYLIFVYEEEVNEKDKDNKNFKNWSIENLIEFTHLFENLFDNDNINKWKILNLYKMLLNRSEISEQSKINIFERVSLAKDLIVKELKKTKIIKEQNQLKEYLKIINELNIPQELENIKFSEDIFHNKINFDKSLQELLSELINILKINDGSNTILIKKLNQLKETDDFDIIKFDWPRTKEELLKKELPEVIPLINDIDKKILL